MHRQREEHHGDGFAVDRGSRFHYIEKAGGAGVDSCLMQDEPELAIGFSRKMGLKGKTVSGRKWESAVCRPEAGRDIDETHPQRN
jgi:hypothetical protein